MKTERHEADLSKVNKDFHEYVDGKLGVMLPSDAPLYVRFWRLTAPTADGVQGLTAWIIELDLLFHGLKFYVRWDMPGMPVKLLVEEPDGTKELLGEWTRG